MAKKKIEETQDSLGDIMAASIKKKPSKKSIEPQLSLSEMEDVLANDIITGVNTALKGNAHQSAYYLSDPSINADVKYWVSTGCSILDLAISNRPNGGFPVGRISEVTGLEQSGKSLLAAHALASTQKMGGLAILIDTEAAISKEYMSAIGIDIDKLLYLPLETMEDIFEAIETIITKVRQKQKDKIVTIVVDSVMGASTKQELEAGFDKDGYATSKSIIISKGMRKLTNLISRQHICLIFTNQLRVKMNVIGFADPYTTSGGKALAFHSSVRLRLKSLGQIKSKVKGIEITVGGKTECIVQKNRMGPPLRKVQYDIYFESGIDNYGSWLMALKNYNLVQLNGAVYSFDYCFDKTTGETEELRFQSKNFKDLLDARPELKEEIYEMICDKYVMEYKANKDFGIDDVTVDTNFLGEDS